MLQEQAETVAIQSLEWLAGEQELFEIFLGSSGADVNDLGKMASDPAFLGSVLDFILMSDQHVTAFCDARGYAYDTPMRARQCLPGGEVVNWT